MIELTRVNVLKVDPTVGVTQGVLEGLASSYSESGHRAPVVIGHPKDNHPAWGWVTKCYSEGTNLYCDLDVTQEFHSMLEKRLFSERSVAFYDSSPPVLRHLGFLGATPPRIKGLEPVNLSEEDEETDIVTVTDNIANQMKEFVKPVALYALSEHFEGLTAKSFKTEPVLEDSTITGVVTLSDGQEHQFKMVQTKDDNWELETTLQNPEVIELSEKVRQLESAIAANQNIAVVDEIYNSNRLTEAILPKSDCLKLLGESSSGVAVKLLRNLPSLVQTTQETTEVKPVDYGFGSSFEYAENSVYDLTVAKAKEMGLNPSNPVDFNKAFQNL